MPMFTKRPVAIEAIQLTQECLEAYLFDGALSLPPGLKVVQANYNRGARQILSYKAGVETLEGFMKASVGDWIIKEIGGGFYPCNGEIFKDTYESVDITASKHAPLQTYEPIGTLFYYDDGQPSIGLYDELEPESGSEVFIKSQ